MVEAGVERAQRLHLRAAEGVGQVPGGVVREGQLLRQDLREVRRVHGGQCAVEKKKEEKTKKGEREEVFRKKKDKKAEFFLYSFVLLKKKKRSCNFVGRNI